MNKRQRYIILGIIVLFIAYYFINKKHMNNKKSVLRAVKKKFGEPIAKTVEKIYRLETANFTKGFEGSWGAGMHPVKDSFPYGWNSLRSFWVNDLSYAPSGIVQKREGAGLTGTGGGIKDYLKFPTFMAGAMTLAKVMSLRNNNAGSWYSTLPENQANYNNTIAKIPSTIVSSLT